MSASLRRFRENVSALLAWATVISMMLLVIYINLWLTILTLVSIALLVLVKGRTADPLLLWLMRRHHGRRTAAVLVLLIPTLLAVVFYPSWALLALSASSDLVAVFVIGGKLDRVLYSNKRMLMD